MVEDAGRSGIRALVGPIPLADILDDVPLSRRFGIKQGAKVRCIDDFSRSSVISERYSSNLREPETTYT